MSRPKPGASLEFQRVGKNIYGLGVNVGNYVEDNIQDEYKTREFLTRKSKSQEKTLITLEIATTGKKHVELRKINADGFLRFGDQVQIRNVFNQTFVSSDFSETVGHNKEQQNYATSSSPYSLPVVRNVFIIERPLPQDVNLRTDLQNDVLHFGQKFLLRTHPDYSPTPFFLASHIVTPAICSRYSRQQIVFISDSPTYHACWRILHYDPQKRFKADGDPISLASTNIDEFQDNYEGESFIITHAHTGLNLYTDNTGYATIFGAERELVCKTDKDQARAETTKNLWNLVAAMPKKKLFDD